jgi:hypothetical protein
MHEKGDAVRKLVAAPDFGKLVVHVTAAVELSFGLDGGRITQSAVKERVNLAWDVVTRLRTDFKWSVSRICDHIGMMLRCELNGVSYDPGAMNDVWTPDSLGAARL